MMTKMSQSKNFLWITYSCYRHCESVDKEEQDEHPINKQEEDDVSIPDYSEPKPTSKFIYTNFIIGLRERLGK